MGALAEHGTPRVGRVALRPLYAGPWLLTKLSPASASSTAAPTYSCSAVRGAVGVYVAPGWRGRMSRQGTWGSRHTGHAAMVTAATVDASAVRSAGRYCLSPVVSRVRYLQSAVQATTPQFMRSGSAPSALLLPLCCTVVVASSWGPCSSASWPWPGGRADGACCGKPCAPRCVLYGFCQRCSGDPCGSKSSWCRYQWPCLVDRLWSPSHCPTTPPACAAPTAQVV